MQLNRKQPLKFNKKPLAISLALLLFAGGMQGCSSSSDDSDSSPSGSTPPASSSGNLATLDATKAKARLNLATGELTPEEGNWQVAYEKYIGFSLKKGVKACLAHEIKTLYDEVGKPVADEFKKLTQDNTLEGFNQVDINNTDICTPIESSIKTQISSVAWWTYPDPPADGKVTVHSDDTNGWILKSADGKAYARIKFTEFATRQYTMKMSYEAWDPETQVFKSAAPTPDLDFSKDAAYWDLETNSVSAVDTGDWELKFSKEGRDILIQLNGGASGKGQAGVAGKDGALQVDSVDLVTDPTSTAQVYKYFADSAQSGLSKPGDFGPLHYAVGGGHAMWPTFATYLIEDNNNFYKMQVVSNTGESGSDPSGTLVIRYDEAKAR